MVHGGMTSPSGHPASALALEPQDRENHLDLHPHPEQKRRGVVSPLDRPTGRAGLPGPSTIPPWAAFQSRTVNSVRVAIPQVKLRFRRMSRRSPTRIRLTGGGD